MKILGNEVTYETGTTWEMLAQKMQDQYAYPILLAVEDGRLRELFQPIAENVKEAEFLTVKDKAGYKTYERSLLLVFMKAVCDCLGPKAAGTVKVEYTIGRGCFCTFQDGITESDIAKIKQKMEELIAKNLPIEKTIFSSDQAADIFQSQGMEDNLRLMKYRQNSFITLYALDGYYDYNYGYMVPSTGYLTVFDIVSYEEGVMVMLPDLKEPSHLIPFEDRKKLFSTMYDTTKWSENMGIRTVADLNDQICDGKLTDIILLQEAYQERKISEIASQIAQRGNVKFVMIAGPSSSGKTTFSYRLSVQLRTHGLNPHPIAVDDYFKNREDTPLDENGNYNFECLEAIDVEQFNKDMSDLLAGKTVEMPSFNFKLGRREYKGNYKKLNPDDILVIEGIHGLNDQLSYALPADSKFKVYISALTCLNVDNHNRIPTTDGRLLRRMVRDARTRGTSAKGTISMWPSVRNGEESYIFPFQESADAMFNSASICELAVLKDSALPLLYGIKRGEPEYLEAKRLIKFLNYFLGVSPESLPNNSIIREFVGGGCFHI